LVTVCSAALVKLGSLATSVPNVVAISSEVCRALKATRVPAAMLAPFEDIRLRPNSMTVIAFSAHVLAPYAQPKSSAVVDNYTDSVDTGCLSAISRLQAEAWLACCEQASCSQSSLLTAASRV